MYKYIRIENFRGLDKIEFSPARFNLFVGGNNSCKTTLLESIFIMTGPANPYLPVSTNRFRELLSTGERSWVLFFNRLDHHANIKLTGEFSPGELQEVQMKIEPLIESLIPNLSNPEYNKIGDSLAMDRVNGLKTQCKITTRDKEEKFTTSIKTDGNEFKIIAPKHFQLFPKGTFISAKHGISDNAHRFSNIKIRKQEKEIIEIIRKIEPEINDLSIGSDNVLYCDTGFKELVPVNVAGEGINRLLSIIMAIYEASNGIILIDEVENGFHYSALEHLWQAIFNAGQKFDVQVFATTHSFENIKAYSAVSEKFPRLGNDLKLFRLEKEKRKINIIDIESNMIKTTIENDLEVR